MSITQDIRRAALNLLARREHSTHELLRKLSNKPFDKNDIDPVITALVNEGLLNDQRFTESFIHYRCNKGYGPLHIQMELRERGIAENIIEYYIKNSTHDWFAQAYHVWQKRFKNQLPTDYKTKAQHMRFLQYRGFTHEQISAVLQK